MIRATPADPLFAYRERVLFPFSVLAGLFLVPFAVNNVVRGRYFIAGAILCVVLALGADALVTRLGKRTRVPFSVLVLPIGMGISVALHRQGTFAPYWCYPAVLFFYFVLSRRAANACSAVLLVGTTLMTQRYLGTGLAIRFGMSLVFTIVMLNVVQNVIRDLQARLVEQSITDPLTGAFNRRHLDLRLEEAMAAGRRRAAPAALLLIDIDHFKRVNDRFGHDAGDRVLKRLVALIRVRVRKLDLVFRLGGEEFVVLLPDTAEADALAVAEELCRLIEHARLLEGTVVTVSIGVAGLPPDHAADVWLKQADEALYAAKNGGRNRATLYGAAGAERPA